MIIFNEPFAHNFVNCPIFFTCRRITLWRDARNYAIMIAYAIDVHSRRKTHEAQSIRRNRSPGRARSGLPRVFSAEGSSGYARCGNHGGQRRVSGSRGARAEGGRGRARQKAVWNDRGDGMHGSRGRRRGDHHDRLGNAHSVGDSGDASGQASGDGGRRRNDPRGMLADGSHQRGTWRSGHAA